MVKSQQFHKGDRVQFTMGRRRVESCVKEDRGRSESTGAGCTWWNSTMTPSHLRKSSCQPRNSTPSARGDS